MGQRERRQGAFRGGERPSMEEASKALSPEPRVLFPPPPRPLIPGAFKRNEAAAILLRGPVADLLGVLISPCPLLEAAVLCMLRS